jgi:hypothetical protein
MQLKCALAYGEQMMRWRNFLERFYLGYAAHQMFSGRHNQFPVFNQVLLLSEIT